MPTGVTSDRLAGTLLDTALGDALGLPCEGMSARSIARRFGRVDRFRLLAKTGFVSDDTEQSRWSPRVSPVIPTMWTPSSGRSAVR